MDILVLHGDITQREKFIEAGIETAQVYVAATNSDERNILSCALAKHVHKEATKGKGTLMTICRVRNPMFLEEHKSGKLSKWAGVDHVVHPVDGAIERLMSGLRSSSLTEVIPFEADAFHCRVGSTTRSRCCSSSHSTRFRKQSRRWHATHCWPKTRR